MIKRLYHYVGEYKKYLGIIPFVVLVDVLCELSMPLLMARMIDVGIPDKDVGYIAQHRPVHDPAGPGRHRVWHPQHALYHH